MKCVIPGRCIKVFGRAVHCLSKIGDELYLEALSNGLALRTVNLARSAYACFVFSTNFFQSYEDGSDDSPDKDLQRCKITMKSCLAIFKSLNSLEKTVDRCKMELDLEGCRLVFQMYCHHGITKTYNLTFQECETLQAVFSKDLCPNSIRSPCRVLSDAVLNFPPNQEEITVIATPETLKVKNYTDDEPDPSKVIHTEMTLVPEEFDDYQVGVDAEVTFCLKELRAILSFAELGNQQLNIHFETAGSPIVLCFSGDSAFESDFVLATLFDSPSSQASQATVSQASQAPSTAPRARTTENRQRQSSKRQRNHSTDSLNSSQTINQRPQATDKRGSILNTDHNNKEDEEDWMDEEPQERTHRSSRGPLANTESQPSTSRDSQSSRGAPANTESQPSTSRDSQSSRQKRDGNFFSSSFSHKDSSAKNSSRRKNRGTNESQEDSERSHNPINTPMSTRDASFVRTDNMPLLGDSCPSQPPGSPGQTSRTPGAANISVLEEVEDDDMECIPGTPPSKKFKSMFFNSAPPEQKNSEEAMVLAEDTDDESD